MSSTDRPPESGGVSGSNSPETPSGFGASDYRIHVEKASAGFGWDRWTASERWTGRKVTGPLAGVALLILVLVLIAVRPHEKSRPDDPERAWREATAETKRRFDEEDVTEDDVGDAIEWARSR